MYNNTVVLLISDCIIEVTELCISTPKNYHADSRQGRPSHVLQWQICSF